MKYELKLDADNSISIQLFVEKNENMVIVGKWEVMSSDKF